MFGPLMFVWDPTYYLVLLGAGLSLLASGYVNRTFRKYSEYTNERGYTGSEVAAKILQAANIQNVAIQPIGGDLTDNYNAQTKILSLSQPVAEATSVAALGVAAHECGHAVQDAVDYRPLRIRASLVPVANIGSSLSLPIILLGLFLGQYGQTVINIGITCFSLVLLFQLVTLPVEFNASRRALAILSEEQILNADELMMARKVLFAAALTYVASAISVGLQLVRLLLLFSDRRE